MTKKQIEEKAQELCEKEIGCEEEIDCTCCPYRDFRKTLSEMAEWLLFNQWVSVEDELPPAAKIVLVKTKYNGYFTAQYSAKFEDFLCGAVAIANVTHWMPIPPLAEEGGTK